MDWYMPEETERHRQVRELLREFNGLANTDPERSRNLLQGLFPNSEVPTLWPPLHLELGENTHFGPGCFVNFNCTILDLADVTIGAGTLIGPGCQLITVEHPLEHGPRAEGWERARPIEIGRDCWLGAGAIVLPGVRIGDRCVVAAGAVVTRDVPANSLVAGVPAEVKRTLE